MPERETLWCCSWCGRALMGAHEACGGSFTERGHPRLAPASLMPFPPTAAELASARMALREANNG